MTGQQLLTEVESLRGAIKKPTEALLNRVFDLNDRLTTIKSKRNCVNCATECLARLTELGKKYRTVEIPEKTMIQFQKAGQSKLTKYKIKKPFRPFGTTRTYAEFNTTDAEVESLLKHEPQHVLHFTMTDGSPVDLKQLGKKPKAVKTEAKETDKTE